MHDHRQTPLDQTLITLDRLRNLGRTLAPGQNSAPPLCHDWSTREVDALQVALVTRRPLLLRGEPGSGKTQLARAAAHELGWALHPMTVRPRMEPEDVLYRFDAVERLAWAQAPELRDKLHDNRFYEPGPLWWALDWISARKAQLSRLNRDEPVGPPPVGHVVLIDEIDKADTDLPNSLLEVFGERELSLPCAPHTLSYRTHDALPPLILMTTNEDRELPAPFLRRCVVLSLEVQANDAAWLVKHRAKAHFGTSGQEDARPSLPEAAMLAAAVLMVEERQQFRAAGLTPPGVAEYLDLLHALHELKHQQGWNDEVLLTKIAELARYVFRKHGGEHVPDELQQWHGQ
jgi:MoxR-like ATPase